MKAAMEPSRWRTTRNGIFGHVGREEIARLGNLALVAKKQPGTAEDALEFEVVNRLIVIDARVQVAFVEVDQVAHVDGRSWWRCVAGLGGENVRGVGPWFHCLRPAWVRHWPCRRRGFGAVDFHRDSFKRVVP